MLPAESFWSIFVFGKQYKRKLQSPDSFIKNNNDFEV